MKNALYFALMFVALSVAVVVSVIGLDLHRDLRDADLAILQATASEHNLSLVIAKVGATADTVNAAANEERANWAATSLEAAKTGRDLRMLIARVDRSLVDGTLLHVNAITLPLLDAQVRANGDQLAITVHKLGETADGLTAATASLDARVADPEISKLLGRANVIAGNFETISANSAAMSTDMQLAVHRLAAPPTKFHQFLDAAWTAAKFGSLFVP